MRCVVQRVLRASVVIDDATHASIERGLLVLAGLTTTDSHHDLTWMADKLTNLRIFPDADDKMNLSMLDVSDPGAPGSGILVVPNFTVAGDTRKGRRPSFDSAMQPPEAERTFARFVDELSSRCRHVSSGVFGADMQVHLVNDGPVTVLVESPSRATKESDHSSITS